MTIYAAAVERRLFWLTLAMSAAGILGAAAFFGWRQGISFAAGCALAAVDLLWLRSTVRAILPGDLKRSKSNILGGFFLRLLLIPLCLYVMIRFLFLGIIAAVAGFAVFVCSVGIEGILEAFVCSRK
jgi:hypothetical protein